MAGVSKPCRSGKIEIIPPKVILNHQLSLLHIMDISHSRVYLSCRRIMENLHQNLGLQLGYLRVRAPILSAAYRSRLGKLKLLKINEKNTIRDGAVI